MHRCNREGGAIPDRGLGELKWRGGCSAWLEKLAFYPIVGVRTLISVLKTENWYSGSHPGTSCQKQMPHQCALSVLKSAALLTINAKSAALTVCTLPQESQ